MDVHVKEADSLKYASNTTLTSILVIIFMGQRPVHIQECTELDDVKQGTAAYGGSTTRSLMSRGNGSAKNLN
jgi:hypothetical protein